MKPVITSLFFACLISCNKQNITPVTVLPKVENTSCENCIVGNWNWTATAGGMLPDRTPKTEGYTMNLILTSKSTYVIYKNSSILKQGTYRIDKGSDFNYMIFDNDPGLRIVMPAKDQLQLGDTSACGPLYTYQRAAN